MADGGNGGIMRRRLTGAEKAAVLAAVFAPGGSVAAAAERFGVSTAAIYMWRRKFGESPAPQYELLARRAPESPVQQTFMPVRVAALTDSVVPSRAAVAGPVGNLGRIEVTLGNGRVLKVDANIDPAALAVIVAALDGDARLRQAGPAP
jgi:transposase